MASLLPADAGHQAQTGPGLRWPRRMTAPTRRVQQGAYQTRGRLVAALCLTGTVVAIALGRDWCAQRSPGVAAAVEVAGYSLLLTVAFLAGRRADLPGRALGLGRDRLPLRLGGGLLLGGTLAFPALHHGVAAVPLLQALPGATIIAAVEELLFRGMLFALLQRAFGGKAAVVLSSLAFALAHAALYPWPVLLLGLAAGLLLGTWRLRYGDLVAPLIGHALADAAAAALLAS